ncbi:MAG TPA: hypothetical protein DC064_00540 [Cyanobacteria bacterium UBA9273]|nr:hypothetical protein [Cyanobacteria bacterium UBA9273]
MINMMSDKSPIIKPVPGRVSTSLNPRFSPLWDNNLWAEIHSLPSHFHTLTPSHPHTLTPSHPPTLTPSHPHPYFGGIFHESDVTS